MTNMAAFQWHHRIFGMRNHLSRINLLRNETVLQTSDFTLNCKKVSRCNSVSPFKPGGEISGEWGLFVELLKMASPWAF